MFANPAPTSEVGYSELITVRETPSPRNRFLGSPAVTYHKNKLLVYSDEFGAGAGSGVGNLDESEDFGETWSPLVSPMTNIFWGRFLDFDPDTLYLYGTTAENQQRRIASSVDGGNSWVYQTLTAGNFHTAPTNYIVVDGILYVPIERVNTGTMRPVAVMIHSCPINDLMNPAAWTVSNEILHADHVATFGGIEFLEFNIAYHDGQVHLFGRILYGGEHMAHLTYDISTNTITPVGKVSCPWGWCKFHLIKCPMTGCFLLVGNERHPSHQGGIDEDRTVVKLWASRNLVDWTELKTLVDIPEEYWRTKSAQYPSMYVHENNLYVAYRVSDEGNTQHNSNLIKSCTYQNFQNWITI